MSAPVEIVAVIEGYEHIGRMPGDPPSGLKHHSGDVLMLRLKDGRVVKGWYDKNIHRFYAFGLENFVHDQVVSFWPENENTPGVGRGRPDLVLSMTYLRQKATDWGLPLHHAPPMEVIVMHCMKDFYDGKDFTFIEHASTNSIHVFLK